VQELDAKYALSGTPTASQSEPLFTIPPSPSSDGESPGSLPGNISSLVFSKKYPSAVATESISILAAGSSQCANFLDLISVKLVLVFLALTYVKNRIR